MIAPVYECDDMAFIVWALFHSPFSRIQRRAVDATVCL